MHLTLEDGKKVAMPRYYKDKLYTRDERSEISGYQKGEMEKRFVEHAAAITARERNESVQAAFDRYFKTAAEGRSKI